MKNILKKIAKFFRRIGYVSVGPFKDGKALALVFIMWNYYDHTRNLGVVVVDEDYEIVEWTNYHTIKEAEEALYGDK